MKSLRLKKERYPEKSWIRMIWLDLWCGNKTSMCVPVHSYTKCHNINTEFMTFTNIFFYRPVFLWFMIGNSSIIILILPVKITLRWSILSSTIAFPWKHPSASAKGIHKHADDMWNSICYLMLRCAMYMAENLKLSWENFVWMFSILVLAGLSDSVFILVLQIFIFCSFLGSTAILPSQSSQIRLWYS